MPGKRLAGQRLAGQRLAGGLPQISVILLIVSLCTGPAYAQRVVTVPQEIQFANQRLELSRAARKKIQTDVDALIRHEKYFMAKVERIDAYFPLIEAVLDEERVPEDIKYLVIQESALVGDAVSSSNAIGYWQFKEPSAREVGLTINGAVDERMHIVAATRGAARYLKKNNATFDNWLYALIAYYEGPGGALKKTNKSKYGARKMRLESDTHWYALKFLSHKLAFEAAVGQNPSPPVQLTAHAGYEGQTLGDVARVFDVTEEDLSPYNHWLRQRRIPQNKTYSVIVPQFDEPPVEAPLAQNKAPQPVTKKQTKAQPTEQAIDNPTYFAERTDTEEFPIIEQRKSRVFINGIPGIVARAGEDVGALARRAEVSSSKLVRYNDLTSRNARIEEGQAYYVRSKRNRALAHYHTAAPGETLWSISQRLGIKLKKLMRNNRLREEKDLAAGQVLWARFIRPESVAATYGTVPPPVEETPAVLASSEEDTFPITASTRSDEANSPSAVPTHRPDSSGSVVRDEPLAEEEKREISDPKGLADVEEDVWRAEDLPTEHIIAPGETLFSIANQYKLSPRQLAEYNQIKFGDILIVGSPLRLTSGGKTPTTNQDAASSTQAPATATTQHEVQAGETMFQIARRYEITIKELMEWNNKDGFDLAAGEVLKVAR